MPQKAETQPTVEALIDRAADRYAASLRTFKPWHRTNGIAERSFQFATVFLGTFPDAFAFEVLVPISGKRRADFQPYLYFAAEERAVLLSCRKTVSSRAHADAIESDMAGMSPLTFQQLQKRYRDAGAHAKSTVGLILADSWCAEIASRWSRDLLPTEGWTFSSRLIFREHDGAQGSLFWLYAHKGLSPSDRV